MRAFTSILFNKIPQRWGLRGDPFLWTDLSEYFSKVPLPGSEIEFMIEFSIAFEKITGKTLASKEPIFIKKYDQGGMSSGYVDPGYWEQNLLPVLIERLNENI